MACTCGYSRVYFLCRILPSTMPLQCLVRALPGFEVPQVCTNTMGYISQWALPKIQGTFAGTSLPGKANLLWATFPLSFTASFISYLGKPADASFTFMTQKVPTLAKAMAVERDPKQASPTTILFLQWYGFVTLSVTAVCGLQISENSFFRSPSVPSTKSPLSNNPLGSSHNVLIQNPKGIGFRNMAINYASVTPPHANMDSSITNLVEVFHFVRKCANISFMK